MVGSQSAILGHSVAMAGLLTIRLWAGGLPLFVAGGARLHGVYLSVMPIKKGWHCASSTL